MKDSVCVSVTGGEGGEGLVAGGRGVAQGGVLEMSKYKVSKEDFSRKILIYHNLVC